MMYIYECHPRTSGYAECQSWLDLHPSAPACHSPCDVDASICGSLSEPQSCEGSSRRRLGGTFSHEYSESEGSMCGSIDNRKLVRYGRPKEVSQINTYWRDDANLSVGGVHAITKSVARLASTVHHLTAPGALPPSENARRCRVRVCATDPVELKLRTTSCAPAAGFLHNSRSHSLLCFVVAHDSSLACVTPSVAPLPSPSLACVTGMFSPARSARADLFPGLRRESVIPDRVSLLDLSLGRQTPPQYPLTSAPRATF
jgi:hypothetical protein